MSYYVLDAAFRSEETEGLPRHRCVVAGEQPGGCKLPAGGNAWSVLGVTTHAQDREGRSVTVRRLGVATCEAASAINIGDHVVVADDEGRVRAASGPAAQLGTTGANNAIAFTLRNALLGNGATEVETVASGNNTPLSAVLSGSTIVINLATNGGGTATSTAAQVIAFVNAHAVLSQLVKATAVSGSSGAGVSAAANALFAGGLDSTNRVGVAQSSASAEGDLVDVLLTP